MWGRPRHALIAGLLALSACEITAPPPQDPPAEAPRTPDVVEPAPPTGSAGQESQVLEAYYRRVEDGLLARGLLRTAEAPSDAPFGARQLVENFVRIAVFSEFTEFNGAVIAQQSEGVIHRWRVPVRIELVFGETVDPAKVNRDRAAITAYAARLSRVTGHPISVVPSNGNFTVFIVNEPERKALSPELSRALPRIDATLLNAVQNIRRSDYCLVLAYPGSDNHYVAAAAIIRGEHPDLFRLSCIHEEIAQGLGLPNDSPNARPSVFNDDEEFGLLTRHDEYLLRILYDPRLEPGMTAEEGMPIVRRIVEEIGPGEGDGDS